MVACCLDHRPRCKSFLAAHVTLAASLGAQHHDVFPTNHRRLRCRSRRRSPFRGLFLLIATSDLAYSAI